MNLVRYLQMGVSALPDPEHPTPDSWTRALRLKQSPIYGENGA